MKRTMSLLCLVALGVTSARAAEPAADPTSVAADEALLKKAGVAAGGPDLLDFLRRQTPGPDEQQRIAALIEQLDSPTFKKRDAATRALEKCGPHAVAVLRAAIPGRGPEMTQRLRRCIAAVERADAADVPAAAVRLLRDRRPAGAAAVLLGYLPFVADAGVEEEVLTALLGLGVKDGRPDPVVVAALADEAPAVRAAAALVVGRHGDDGQRQRVRALLDDTDARVRLRAAQGLLAAGDKKAVPALLPLLSDAPLELAAQAEDLLARLAGEQAPKEALAESRDERRQCRAAWEKWWQGQKDTLDLSKGDRDLSFGGLDAQAREVARKNLTALFKGDAEGLRQTTAPPFCFFQHMVPDQQQLNQGIMWLCDAIKKDAATAGITFQLGRVSSRDAFLASTSDLEKEFRNFLEGKKRAEIRIVHARLKKDDGKDPDNMALVVVVHFSNGKGRVVGFGEIKGKK